MFYFTCAPEQRENGKTGKVRRGLNKRYIKDILHVKLDLLITAAPIQLEKARKRESPTTIFYAQQEKGIANLKFVQVFRSMGEEGESWEAARQSVMKLLDFVFKYNKTEDSVLVVNKQDYSSCNINNPILKLQGGDSVFQFNMSGPFYFISGVADKLIMVVLAERKKKPAISPSPSPSSSIPPPSSDSPSSDQDGGSPSSNQSRGSKTRTAGTTPSKSGASVNGIDI